MQTNPTNLPWLLAPPNDFRLQVRALAELKSESSFHARQLALHHLDVNQLHTFGTGADQESSRANQIKTVKLGVLSNGTTDLILPAFVVSALRHGVWLESRRGIIRPGGAAGIGSLIGHQPSPLRLRSSRAGSPWACASPGPRRSGARPKPRRSCIAAHRCVASRVAQQFRMYGDPADSPSAADGALWQSRAKRARDDAVDDRSIQQRSQSRCGGLLRSAARRRRTGRSGRTYTLARPGAVGGRQVSVRTRCRAVVRRLARSASRRRARQVPKVPRARPRQYTLGRRDR